VVEPEEDSDGGDDVAADFGFINLEKPQTLRSFHAYSDWTKALHYADPAPKVCVIPNLWLISICDLSLVVQSHAEC
jgi:hypothetical protein